MRRVTPPDDDFGVDRLSLSFPARLVGLDPMAWGSVTTRTKAGPDCEPIEEWTRGVSLPLFTDADTGKPLASVYVGATVVEGRVWGKVECNPARLRDPDGASLLPVNEVGAIAELMAVLAQEHVEPQCDVSEMRVKRLDVARDFREIADTSFYVRGLLNVKRPYAKRTYMYADPQRNNAETLAAGSNAGMCRLYDQHRAYGEKAPEGALRWEVEARAGGWLETPGIARVKDATVERIEALAKARWEWSRMGTEVVGSVDLIEAVEKLCRLPKDDPCYLTRGKADRLLGMLLRESLGVGSPASRATDYRYEAIKRRLGVVPSADLFGDGRPVVGVSRRLDFEAGREVAA